jgi:hypothetical protein
MAIRDGRGISGTAKRTEQSVAQIKIFDSIVVPVLACVERRVEPPACQSVFAVFVEPY